MKGLALILFLALAAQVHSSGVDTTFTPVALGEVPWYVHLRVAVRHTGDLRTCAGSIINHRWLLTSARCVRYNRYIWVRFGVDVFRPSLVAETNTLRVFPQHNYINGTHDLSIINMTRHRIDLPNDYYGAPLTVTLPGLPIPPTGKFCSYGRLENGAPGVRLACIELSLTQREDGYIEARGAQGWTTEFDQGAPLVADGVQYGVLNRMQNNQEVGVFLNPAYYRDWIESIIEASLPIPEESYDEDDEVENVKDNGEARFLEHTKQAIRAKKLSPYY